MTSISVRSIWSLIFFFHSFQLCNCVANLKEIGRQLRKLQMWRFSSISILLNFFRNWKLFVFTYSYKKLALVSSFQSTNFHSNQMIGCKDITVLKISSIMRIFPEPEVRSQKFEKPFLLLTFFSSFVNFSSVTLIVTSESWCVNNNNLQYLS